MLDKPTPETVTRSGRKCSRKVAGCWSLRRWSLLLPGPPPPRCAEDRVTPSDVAVSPSLGQTVSGTISVTIDTKLIQKQHL